ncbi:hypothetical protein ABT009_41930 [Streptomyces sp. NPDC002896]|uniref:hypothetical protein n=1 Tax=Streptomyces sp. NPDC002896 TaxID=3154438 RepID=UPI003333755E
MSGYGAGIRRGVMAADRFTQIRNDLFRDPKISFRAKGIFGLISTHRDGWRVSVTELARLGPDGKEAVTTALKELEQHGYLIRERERRSDGTLGAAAYFITDMPQPPEGDNSPAAPPTVPAAGKNRRWAPESENPAQAEPAQADPPTKNTKPKKTTDQNTNPVRPSVPSARTGGPDDAARTDPGAGQSAPQDTPIDQPSAGVRLLLSIGARHPKLLLTGAALRDQGRIVTAMLDAGWSPEQLHHVIAGRPLPNRIRTSVDAIVAARLRAAQSYPPPATCADDADPAQPPPTPKPSRAACDSRTVIEAITYRALAECAGCGRPGCAPGEDLCPACLDWPWCRSCTSPTPRRAHPGGDGRCATCATALHPLEGSTQ